MKGFAGRIMHINLSTQKVNIEEPEEKFYRRYLGGACMGGYYVASKVPADTEPLGDGNILAFTVSAATGAPLSGASRHCVTCKSPQTGTIASSEAGGFWGPELKFAGLDGLVIEGKSEKPVYLWIKDGTCEFRSAESLWGKDTGYTQDRIREELEDNRIRIAQIGKSGENLVKYSCIVNELKHFNGRNGMGAVMGSKNLKAIAVRGTGKPEFADPDKIRAMAKQAGVIMKESEFYPYFKRVGTTVNVDANIPVGGLPTRNWTAGTFEHQDKMTGEVYADTMMDKNGTCWACLQSCKRDIKEGITEPVEIEPRFGGPEYETIGMCGSNIGIGDLNEISAINQLASRTAVDTIALGGVIGLVMEAYEKGIITSEQLDGIEAPFGSYDAAIKLTEKIINRDGIGDILAEGTAVAAKYFGADCEKIAVHVKNKEFPAHMPHLKASLSLAYALNNFGPDHVSSEHDGALAAEPIGERIQGMGFYDAQDPVELSMEKARLFAYSQRFNSAIDSACVCNFIYNTWTMFGFNELIELINAATGWDYTLFELALLGERRVNIMRAFNCRDGFGAKDDMLPEKLFKVPLSDDGPSSGSKIDKQAFLEGRKYYYAINGWDEQDGVPGRYKLLELGLDWLVG